MRVLGLVSSGRKDGNTNTLVDTILEGAKSKGHVTKKVFLADFKIHPIGDCATCREAGACVIDDDFDKVMNEALEADCIIFGTPVYWWGPSAQLKTFMDRWVCRATFDKNGSSMSKMLGKKYVLAVPHQNKQLSATRLLFAMMEDSLDFLQMVCLSKIQTVAEGRNEASNDQAALRHAFELGARMTEVESMKKPTGSVTFNFANPEQVAEVSTFKWSQPT